jgi:BNR repeat-like domain
VNKTRVFLLVLLVGAVCFSAMAAEGPSPTEKPGPRKSGFYDFWQIPVTGPSGVGSLPQTANCFIGPSTQPADYAGNFLLDCDGETPHNETTIVVDPNDRNHVVGGYHSYRLFFNGATVVERVAAAASSTFDGGDTWHEVIPPTTPYQFTGDPGLAFDSNSRLYYSNIADHEGPGGSFTGPSVVVAASDDGGVTWTHPVTVAKGQTAITPQKKGFGPNIFNDKPFLAADASASSPFGNRVYVTWTRFAQFVSPTATFFASPIYVAASNNGTQWTQPKAISGFSPFCEAALFGAPNECDLNQDSYPAVAPNGRVYVTFENFNTFGLNQILAVSSTNGGATWTSPSQVGLVQDLNFPQNSDGRDTLTGCALRYSIKANTAADPSDATGNTVYVAFADNRNGTAAATNTDVFLGKSTDGGASWSIVNVDTSPNDQFYPWVAVAGDGTVNVGYMDRGLATGPDQTDCLYGFAVTKLDASGAFINKPRVDTGFSDAGHSRWFSSSTNSATRFIGDYNGLAVDSDGTTWSLWTDQRALFPNPPSPERNHAQHVVAATH